MKGTIMYSQSDLERIVSMLRGLESSIADAESILATVDTSSAAGGDQMTSDVVPMSGGAGVGAGIGAGFPGVTGVAGIGVGAGLSGIAGSVLGLKKGFSIPAYTWDYTVRGRVQAQIHYLRNQAEKVTELIRAIERVNALYQETENRLRSLDPDSAPNGWNGHAGPYPDGHGGWIMPDIPPQLQFDENGNVIGVKPSGQHWGPYEIFNYAFSMAMFGPIFGGLYYNNATWESSVKIKSPIDLIKGNWTDGAEKKGFNIGIGIDAKTTGTLWKGKKEGSTDWGKGSAELSVGEISASGGVGFTLYKDGKFSPELYGKVGVEANLLHGSADGQIGSDEYNVHGSVDGKVGGAYAKAQGSIGLDGVKGEAGVGAYAVKGEVKGGFTIFGIKVNVKGEAAVGVEAKVKGGVNTKGAEGQVNVGPFGLGIEIDWSGFKMPKLPKISLPSFNPLSLLI